MSSLRALSATGHRPRWASRRGRLAPWTPAELQEPAPAGSDACEVVRVRALPARFRNVSSGRPWLPWRRTACAGPSFPSTVRTKYLGFPELHPSAHRGLCAGGCEQPIDPLACHDCVTGCSVRRLLGSAVQPPPAGTGRAGVPIDGAVCQGYAPSAAPPGALTSTPVGQQRFPGPAKGAVTQPQCHGAPAGAPFRPARRPRRVLRPGRRAAPDIFPKC